MSRRPRRNHSAEFKAKVALAAVRGDRHRADGCVGTHRRGLLQVGVDRGDLIAVQGQRRFVGLGTLEALAAATQQLVMALVAFEESKSAQGWCVVACGRAPACAQAPLTRRGDAGTLAVSYPCTEKLVGEQVVSRSWA